MNEMYELDGACLTVHLPEEVDHPVSDDIKAESDRIMEKQYVRTIIFDFEETDFMDSSGIGLLMGRYRALGMCINKVLHLSGVHRYIEIQKVKEEGKV